MSAPTFEGRPIRFKACEYLLACENSHRRVSGFAVDAGQIPRFAVHDDGGGWWVGTDWVTGCKIVDGAANKADCARETLLKLREKGEPAYRMAVEHAARNGGLNAGVTA